MQSPTQQPLPPPTTAAALPHPGPPPEFPELPAAISPGPRWKAWTAPVALFAIFGAALVGATVVGLFAAAFGEDLKHPSASTIVASTYLQDILLVVGAFAFARISAVPRATDFGLRLKHRWRAVGWTAAVWFVFFVVTAIWAYALGLDEAEKNIREELGTESGTFGLLAAAALVTVAAPIGEEIFFRGYFYRSLSNWHGFWPAAILTGIVFGAIHIGSAEPEYLVPLAIFGFLLCLLYRLTGSLYPCVALHALNNSLAFGVGLDWSWQIPVTMVVSVAICCLILRGLASSLDAWSRRSRSRVKPTAVRLAPLPPTS